MADLQVRTVQSEADLDVVRQLCRAYREALLEATGDRRDVVERDYPADEYETLLASLAEKHAHPDGAIFLGLCDGRPLACAMTQRISATTCEIKRVFTDPAGRGLGLARALVLAAMDQARRDGYEQMVLDTIAPLKTAIALYASIGFEPIEPYHEVPAASRDLYRFFGMAL